MTSRLIAAAVVVLLVVVNIVAHAARLNGDAGAASILLLVTRANPYVMAVLATGAAWLIVRSARIDWLAILATAILLPLQFASTTRNNAATCGV